MTGRGAEKHVLCTNPLVGIEKAAMLPSRETADRVVSLECAGRQVAPGDRHTRIKGDRIHAGMVTSEAADDAEAERLNC